ncbi:hypothetical protein [Hydrocoleum sp. CS-953]|nr:hypothetical protein [Hydrocoleum sp. CS-953]
MVVHSNGIGSVGSVAGIGSGEKIYILSPLRKRDYPDFLTNTLLKSFL